MYARYRSFVLNVLILTTLVLSTGFRASSANVPEKVGASPARSSAAEQNIQAEPSVIPDFSKPFEGLKQAYGTRYVLTILWDPEYPEKYNPVEDRPSRDIVENMLFGPKPSVRDYFLENSDERFTIENAGVLGWYSRQLPYESYWDYSDPGDKDRDGWIDGHTRKWAEAIRLADQDFNFKEYDINNNGVLTADELAVLIVQPVRHGEPAGGNLRPVYGRESPQQDLKVDKVKISEMVEVYSESLPTFSSLGIFAHELSHILLQTPDMYTNLWDGFDNPYAPGLYSLMDNASQVSHLDPFLKLKLGWVQPVIVTANDRYTIPSVEAHHVVYILYDPARGQSEYFIVENRWGLHSYDSALPDAGLAIWHIMEAPKVFSTVPPPPGVDSNRWKSIPKDDWGRRAIRLIRPVYAFDDTKALWAGCYPETGYNLLSSDPDPRHVTLMWADGTPSGFTIQSIPGANPKMEVFISVPWDANFEMLEQGLYLHNDTNNSIWVALGYYDECINNPASKGWWKVDPGQTAHPLDYPLNDQYYFYWAIDSTGRVWSGEYKYWVHPHDAFEHISMTMDAATAKSLGYEQRAFNVVRREGSSSHTINFTLSPPSCNVDVSNTFSALWSQESVYSGLGCPLSYAYESMAAEERFQYGSMLWRDSSDRIYVLYDDGTWVSYEDTFVGGTDPDYSCGVASTPPSPRRGFNKVWCYQSGVRNRLGDAVEKEFGYGMQGGGPAEVFQDFSGGMMFQSHRFNTIYALFNNGTWLRSP